MRCRFEEVETVGDAGRNSQGGLAAFREFDKRGEFVRRGAGAEVAEADLGAAAEDREVVVVPDVDMYAAEDSGEGRYGVPLDVRDGDPGLAEELGERAAVVAVHFKPAEDRAIREGHLRRLR